MSVDPSNVVVSDKIVWEKETEHRVEELERRNNILWDYITKGGVSIVHIYIYLVKLDVHKIIE